MVLHEDEIDEAFDHEYGSGGQDGNIRSMILSQLVPEEYFYDPLNAEPTLDNLRSEIQNYASTNNAGDNPVDGIRLSAPDGAPPPMFDSALTSLLGAAEKDVNIHMARVKAVLSQDPGLLETYSPSTDHAMRQRMQRLEEMQAHRIKLQQETRDIINNLNDDFAEVEGHSAGAAIEGNSKGKQKTTKQRLTKEQRLEKRLEAWERALQIYAYTHNDGREKKDSSVGVGSAPGAGAGAGAGTKAGAAGGSTSTAPSSVKNANAVNDKQASLTMIQLLQHLCRTSTATHHNVDTTNINAPGQPIIPTPTDPLSDSEQMCHALQRATQMCAAVNDKTSSLLQDAVEYTADTFQSYSIHLIAHSIAANNTYKQTSDIQAKFLHHGREALKIGHALEMAEAKRRQSEQASVLLRRWWMMENLAVEEDASEEDLRVEEEVRGDIPISSSKMDPLFTREENGLEAAKTLKSLRMVVKCRSSNAKAGDLQGLDGMEGGGGGPKDPQVLKRFELTDQLIKRTSVALEGRLLNTFSKLYVAGGQYDFSSVVAAKRSGRLNWVKLREVSESLMSFDSGRSLHKLYVQLVVSTKFPELFQFDDDGANSSIFSNRQQDTGDDEINVDEDIDGTRSKLSNLFHRVCEVCTEEFQLIAHIFSPSLPQHLHESSLSSKTSGRKTVSTSSSSFPKSYPLQIARALLQRLISDPKNGMQVQINGLLESIDQRGDFDSGAKKLDTFVVIHEKAAGLFSLLREAALKMGGMRVSASDGSSSYNSNSQSVSALVQFLTTQEMSLSNGQRRGYLNLELRLLHHHCCANLDRNGGRLLRPVRSKEDSVRNSAGSGGLADYRSPIMPLDQEHIVKEGLKTLYETLLKPAVLRQPLIHATDSLARARLMFGSGSFGGTDIDSTARVVSTVFSQMCNFYGPSYLYPITDSLGKMLVPNPPTQPPTLPSPEGATHDLGVNQHFWLNIERIYGAAKSFDRELWAENRTGSMRVWEILVQTRSQTSLTLAKERRVRFFQELEERGESVILRALDTLSNHIHWILVTGGEHLLKSTTGNRRDGPYAVSSGSILDSTNTPAVKALTSCLKEQFIKIQFALMTPQSLSAFWTAVSRRTYDILVARLLQSYKVSTVGAVVLSRDVEALRSVSMLAGTDHSHWDVLRELLTLYMTPPDSLKTMLVGAEGDINSGKGMFGRVGKDPSIVFMSRRVDYRYRTNQGLKKSRWVHGLLEELGVKDPTDGRVNVSNYTAANIVQKN